MITTKSLLKRLPTEVKIFDMKFLLCFMILWCRYIKKFCNFCIFKVLYGSFIGSYTQVSYHNMYLPIYNLIRGGATKIFGLNEAKSSSKLKYFCCISASFLFNFPPPPIRYIITYSIRLSDEFSSILDFLVFFRCW